MWGESGAGEVGRFPAGGECVLWWSGIVESGEVSGGAGGSCGGGLRGVFARIGWGAKRVGAVWGGEPRAGVFTARGASDGGGEVGGEWATFTADGVG